MKTVSEEKTRILFVVTSLSAHGGIEETLRIFCHYVDKDRFSPAICSIRDSREQILADFNAMSIDIFALGRSGAFYDLATLYQVYRVIRQFQPHIVHSHNNKGNWHGRLAAKAYRRCAIVTTHHDLGDAWGFSKFRQQKITPSLLMDRLLYPLLNRWLNVLNDKVIVVSEAVRKVYCDNKNSKYQVIYAPFDDQLFYPFADALLAHSGKQQTWQLGVVARLAAEKGHIYLLQAMLHLRRSHPNTHLHIKGDGALRKQLEQYARQHGLQDCVTFHGDCPHNRRLFENLQIYIQPSLTEGCSITLLEAMACALPVIGTAQNGPKEFIVHEQNGLLVPVRQPQELARAIANLLDNPQKAAQLAKAGKKTACTQFSAQVFLEHSCRLYRQLLTE